MSNIFITDVIGTGTYAVPASDAALASATTGFDGLLSGVANLAYDRVLAWVEDAGGPGGAEGNRTLNCLVEKFTYSGEECPDETEVDTMTAAIEAALEADANITSVDQQQVHIFQAGAYFLWQRDAAGGFLYPNTSTDDIAVGGHVAPNGKWFDDGDLVLGGDTMSGAEVLRVIGDERLEGGLLQTEQSAVPIAPAAGEGTWWVKDDTPSTPYFTDDAGTDHQLLYADVPGVGFRNSEWGGNNDYIPIVNTGWTILGNLQFEGTNTWTPSVFGLILSRPGTTGTVNLRLYDYTNALVIGTIDVTASGKAYYSDTTLSNLPATTAILEIQAMKSAAGASKGYLHYWELL
jgi:hypothetical protein